MTAIIITFVALLASGYFILAGQNLSASNYFELSCLHAPDDQFVPPPRAGRIKDWPARIIQLLGLLLFLYVVLVVTSTIDATWFITGVYTLVTAVAAHLLFSHDKALKAGQLKYQRTLRILLGIEITTLVLVVTTNILLGAHTF